ncbi:hypothetical protein, partial [Bacillus thuringiensis]|uniref:hypothetical protein n=1 Tax=Bacillus thuringiensis TaxID=1428 RepID=UPI0019D5B18E
VHPFIISHISLIKTHHNSASKRSVLSRISIYVLPYSLRLATRLRYPYPIYFNLQHVCGILAQIKINMIDPTA